MSEEMRSTVQLSSRILIIHWYLEKKGW